MPLQQYGLSPDICCCAGLLGLQHNAPDGYTACMVPRNLGSRLSCTIYGCKYCFVIMYLLLSVLLVLLFVMVSSYLGSVELIIFVHFFMPGLPCSFVELIVCETLRQSSSLLVCHGVLLKPHPPQHLGVAVEVHFLHLSRIP